MTAPALKAVESAMVFAQELAALTDCTTAALGEMTEAIEARDAAIEGRVIDVMLAMVNAHNAKHHVLAEPPKCPHPGVFRGETCGKCGEVAK